jgi:hypothetical protein
MNRYLLAAASVLVLLSAAPLIQAETTNPDRLATIDLAPEQEDAIYAAVTEGMRETDPPEIRVGDELPWWAQVRTLPDSLQLESVKGLLYAVLLVRNAGGVHNQVFLVDSSTNKVVRIIRRPLTFKF